MRRLFHSISREKYTKSDFARRLLLQLTFILAVVAITLYLNKKQSAAGPNKPAPTNYPGTFGTR